MSNIKVEQVEKIRIGNIPAIIWGKPSDKMIIAVHGSHSSKMDDFVWVLAEVANDKGYQVISFDLPQHGERVYETNPCMVQECVKELIKVLEEAKKRAKHIYLFGNSMGAYFGLMSYQDAPVERAFLLSPVTDMKQIIHNIMNCCNVTPEDLKEKGTIVTPMETLYWDYYCYVNDNPVMKWDIPTCILRGENDIMCSHEMVKGFADIHGCEFEEQPGGEHWFHTDEQLEYLKDWLVRKL